MHRTALAMVMLAAVLGCADTSITGTSEPAAIAANSAVTPTKWSCTDPEDPHCLPYEDPCPTCEGIYVDFGLSWADCLPPYINDMDQDGLDDACEWKLARAFRPRLMIHPYDADPTMEPYWAAKLYSEDGTNCRLYPEPCYSPRFVQVMYLFAYHNDLGAFGHFGDSEFIVLWLAFDPELRRWNTSWMFTSAHHGSPQDFSMTSAAYEIDYSEAILGYPRVWVSKTKHANYINSWYCSFGDIIGTDTCDGNMDAGRIEIRTDRNLGSRVRQLVGTVGGETTLYRGYENFWTRDRFCGWNVDPTNCATAYRTFLNEFGY